MNTRPPGSSFGKPDHTGRSSGKLTGRIKKLKAPKPPFAWQSIELLTSAAWRARSINLARLIDALQVDHCNHAGTENGNLMSTYDQLVALGASRSCLKDAIAEGMFLGLIAVEPGGRWADSNQPSRYRLTWLYNDRDDTPATDEWRRRSETDIKKWREGRRQRRKEKQNPGATSSTTVVPFPALRTRKRGKSKT